MQQFGKISERERACIRIRGAHVHNLKGISVDIPRDALTVVTGVSGSGKSSLAFDTLFAEGYRKYMDSLSTRARQLLEQMPRPEVDRIEGLTPVIAIEQRTGAGNNPRSTVATMTEIADYSRILWAMAGQPYCPDDGGRIVYRSLDTILENLLNEFHGLRMILLAPYITAKPAVLRGEIPHLRQKGFQRVRLDGQLQSLDGDDWIPRGRAEHSMDLVIDRLVLNPDQRSRLADSLELAFREGSQRAVAWVERHRDSPYEERLLSLSHACEICGRVFDELRARNFSWDHPDGACETCGGLGETLQFAPDLIVPDPSLSVRKGAVKPWRFGSKRMIIERNARLKQFAEQLPFDPTCPWSELPEETRKLILHGSGNRRFAFKTKPGRAAPEQLPFCGVIPDLEETRRITSSDGLRARLLAFQTRHPCDSCGGTRLKAASRAVQLSGLSFTDFMRMSLAEAREWTHSLALSGFEEAVAGLRGRIHFLCDVGLGYLALERSYNSLSGGEAQRVRLATQLGMGLAGVTYVLDEPTIGLHPVDTAALLRSILRLKESGNTVVVVEHDPDVIRHADHLIEIGPGAGESGGRVVYSGSIEEMKTSHSCKTSAYLNGQRTVAKFVENHFPGKDWLTIEGASEHNLDNLTISFPVGCLTVVTGVSGSGKSTLVNDILGKAAAFRLNRAKEVPGRHSAIRGMEHFERVIRVDQDAIGRSPRSNPATFTKIFDELRKLFAQTPMAKVRGYGTGRFSFNVRGGRCEHCQGDGVVKMDMQFLSDVYRACPSCRGQRYNRETLEVRYRGYSIADVLDMTVDDALKIFSAHPKICSRLETLRAVGLNYLRLGQPGNTLSGGEAQRLKLSLELSKSNAASTLYLLDEPTTGLHWEDIQHLMDLLFRLRDKGHTFVIIEHNLDVMRLADWIVDLGPGGGVNGGQLLFAGTPSELAMVETSPTGRALRDWANQKRGARSE